MGIPNVQELTSERSEKGPGRYMDGALKVSRVTSRETERGDWIKGSRVRVHASVRLYIYKYIRRAHGIRLQLCLH